MLQLFLEIQKAVCLGFFHIPKIGPIIFQVFELIFFQQCENKMHADPCNASYKDQNENLCREKYWQLVVAFRIIKTNIIHPTVLIKTYMYIIPKEKS